jgi:hypothetical protein
VSTDTLRPAEYRQGLVRRRFGQCFFCLRSNSVNAASAFASSSFMRSIIERLSPFSLSVLVGQHGFGHEAT